VATTGIYVTTSYFSVLTIHKNDSENLYNAVIPSIEPLIDPRGNVMHLETWTDYAPTRFMVAGSCGVE
jgi:hypothetical protein